MTRRRGLGLRWLPALQEQLRGSLVDKSGLSIPVAGCWKPQAQVECAVIAFRTTCSGVSDYVSVSGDAHRTLEQHREVLHHEAAWLGCAVDTRPRGRGGTPSSGGSPLVARGHTPRIASTRTTPGHPPPGVVSCSRTQVARPDDATAPDARRGRWLTPGGRVLHDAGRALGVRVPGPPAHSPGLRTRRATSGPSDGRWPGVTTLPPRVVTPRRPPVTPHRGSSLS